jgi:nucleoside phosphorylase
MANATGAGGLRSTLPPIDPPSAFPDLAEVEIKELNRENTDALLDKVDVLLMVVNENELRAVLGLMGPVHGGIVEAIRDSVTFMIGRFGHFLAAVVRTSPGGQGFDGAEQKTTRAVRVVRPSLVISVGVAFGKSPHTQRLGDVIVCSVINDYTHKRNGVKEVRLRSPQPPVSHRLLNLFQNQVGWRERRSQADPRDLCRVIVGPMVSGPNLIDDPTEKEKLLDMFKDAIGGEMEGAAILSAIHGIPGDQKPEGIIIKAICDWADGNKSKEWQPFASHVAASYVLHHLKKREAFGDLARKAPFGTDVFEVTPSKPITGGQKGEVEVEGRRVSYKATWRIHSFNEPLVWDSVAQDMETGIKADVSRQYSDKEANKLAIKKLFENMRSEGVL